MSDLTLQLFRSPSEPDGTPGTLMNGDHVVCDMVELPWYENKSGVSCIPPGKYWVEYLAVSASRKYKDVYHVKDVAGRDGILIHKGNYAGDEALGYISDSDGCLLPCVGHGEFEGQLMGQDSKTGLQMLHGVAKRKSFWLEVIP